MLNLFSADQQLQVLLKCFNDRLENTRHESAEVALDVNVVVTRLAVTAAAPAAAEDDRDEDETPEADDPPLEREPDVLHNLVETY
jgi:hypothetical protein